MMMRPPRDKMMRDVPNKSGGTGLGTVATCPGCGVTGPMVVAKGDGGIGGFTIVGCKCKVPSSETRQAKAKGKSRSKPS